MIPVSTVTLALTGASGMPYAFRLLESLLAANVSVNLLVSQAAQIVAQQEMSLPLPSSNKELQAQMRERHLPAPRDADCLWQGRVVRPDSLRK